MKWFSNDRDDDPDALTGAEDLSEKGGIEAFADDLRSAFPEAPVEPASQQAHLVAMMEAAQLLADEGGSTVRSTSETHGPDRQASGLPKLRRKPVFKSLAAKITAVAVVLSASLGGLATAGALPGPVQHGVATVAGAVGIDLPDPDDQDDQGESDGQFGDENDQGDDQEDANEADDEAELEDPADPEDSEDQADDQDDADEQDEADEAEEQDEADEAEEADDQEDAEEADGEDDADESQEDDANESSGGQSDDDSGEDEGGSESD